MFLPPLVNPMICILHWDWETVAMGIPHLYGISFWVSTSYTPSYVPSTRPYHPPAANLTCIYGNILVVLQTSNLQRKMKCWDRWVMFDMTSLRELLMNWTPRLIRCSYCYLSCADFVETDKRRWSLKKGQVVGVTFTGCGRASSAKSSSGRWRGGVHGRIRRWCCPAWPVASEKKVRLARPQWIFCPLKSKAN